MFILGITLILNPGFGLPESNVNVVKIVLLRHNLDTVEMCGNHRQHKLNTGPSVSPQNLTQTSCFYALCSNMLLKNGFLLCASTTFDSDDRERPPASTSFFCLHYFMFCVVTYNI